MNKIGVFRVGITEEGIKNFLKTLNSFLNKNKNYRVIANFTSDDSVEKFSAMINFSDKKITQYISLDGILWENKNNVTFDFSKCNIFNNVAIDIEITDMFSEYLNFLTF